MAQSFKAIRVNGCISIVGFLGGTPTEQQPTFLECLSHECVVRGVYVGSRMLFEDMNRAIDANGIKPVVDGRIFTLEEAKEAYQYMVSLDVQIFSIFLLLLISSKWDQKHFGKVTIRID